VLTRIFHDPTRPLALAYRVCFQAINQVGVLPVWTRPDTSGHVQTRVAGHFLGDQRLVFILEATTLHERATVL
jgi:hypothetical protein